MYFEAVDRWVMGHGRIHSARTMSFSLMYSSNELLVSWRTSDADATAAPASRDQMALLREICMVMWWCFEAVPVRDNVN